MKRRRPVQVKKSLNIKSILTLTAAFVLVAALSIGGTLAWLQDSTSEVKNTFTVGHVDIDLAETTGNTYKMIPGKVHTKDPKVTVTAGSENSWVFVKVVETNNPKNYLEYSIADGWTELENNTGVYYREYTTNENAQEYSVLKDNKVTVKDGITNNDLKLTEDKYPTMAFTAYAIQKEGFDTAAAAWAEVSELDNTTTETQVEGA